MDAAYHQKHYHFVQFLWGMLIGFIPGRFMQCGYKFSRWYDMV